MLFYRNESHPTGRISANSSKEYEEVNRLAASIELCRIRSKRLKSAKQQSRFMGLYILTITS
jgi:hypothetical protein